MKTKAMKYIAFLVGLWLACNESLDPNWTVIGIGMLAASGMFIIDSFDKSMKSE